MVTSRTTAAEFSRTYHRQMKLLCAQLEEAGLGRKESYMILVSAMMRLVHEDDGDAGLLLLREIFREF